MVRLLTFVLIIPSLLSCGLGKDFVVAYPLSMEYNYGDFRLSELGDSVLVISQSEIGDLNDLRCSLNEKPYAIIKGLDRQSQGLVDIKVSKQTYKRLILLGSFGHIEEKPNSTDRNGKTCEVQLDLYQSIFGEGKFKALIKVNVPESEAYDVISNFKSKFGLPNEVIVERAIQSKQSITFVVSTMEKFEADWKELISLRWYNVDELGRRVICLN